MSPRRTKTEAVAEREPGDDTATATKWPRVQSGGKLDNAAGVEMYEFGDKPSGRYEMRLAFRDGDPGEEVRSFMKDNGFKWDKHATGAHKFQDAGAWVHPIAYENGWRDRLQAEKVYAEVVKMLYAQKGIEGPAEDQGVGF